MYVCRIICPRQFGDNLVFGFYRVISDNILQLLYICTQWLLYALLVPTVTYSTASEKLFEATVFLALKFRFHFIL